jgi:hypothetical protein
MDINEIADILQDKAENDQENNQIDDYDEVNLGNEEEIDKIEVEDNDSNPSEEEEIEEEEEEIKEEEVENEEEENINDIAQTNKRTKSG